MRGEATNVASRWKRLGGAIIDILVVMAIVYPIMFATGILQQSFSEGNLTIGQQIFFSGVGCVVFLILNGYLLFKRGQTIGKVIVKTRIVDMNRNLPNFGKLIILRYFILWLLNLIPIIGGAIGLVNVLFIFGKDCRCLHDYLAGTQVIDA